MTAVGYVYFHGVPGSPDELRLVRPDGWQDCTRLFVPDRATEHPDLSLGAYLDQLASSIFNRFPDGPIRLVGFSLGGVIAIDVARRLIAAEGGRDIAVDLISTPAPLRSGDFLPEMAGRMVFSLARSAPLLFGLLTRVQGIMSHFAPGMLYDQIFSTAAGADTDLVREPGFAAAVRSILANSLQRGARGYRREVLAYAADDSARPSAVERPVRIWQGLADTWTPPGMTQPLVDAFPLATVTTFAGLSHYSTLRAVLPGIFSELG
jgi:pimeloyl-ACP methyl ester carboxylesterase